MATTRDGLYSRFKFLVDIGDAGDGPHGGFGEVSAIGTEVTPSDHREGDVSAATRQIAGVVETTNVALRSGVIRALEFRRWLDDSRTGARSASLTVTIRERNEQQTTPRTTWKLIGARIIKYSSGRPNAGDVHVAIEELVLACDGVEMMETQPSDVRRW